MKLPSLIILISLPVLALCALCLHAALSGQDDGSVVDVSSIIPKEVDGWTVTDLPLGSTEAESQSALKLLDFDSFVQRRYSREDVSITVYIAFWKHGKADTRLVAYHNPDFCWKANGWECVETTSGEEIEAGGVKTRPAEYRMFETNDRRIRVFFWLQANGEPYPLGNVVNEIPSPVFFFKKFFHEVFAGRPEHYFVRIHSELPKDRLLANPMFGELLKDLSRTGISVPCRKDGMTAQ